MHHGISSQAVEFAQFFGISIFSQNFVEFGTGRSLKWQMQPWNLVTRLH